MAGAGAVRLVGGRPWQGVCGKKASAATSAEYESLMCVMSAAVFQMLFRRITSSDLYEGPTSISSALSPSKEGSLVPPGSEIRRA